MKKQVFLSLMLLLASVVPAFGCTIHVENNTENNALIVSEDGTEAIPVGKGKSCKFGGHKHDHFKVFSKGKGKRRYSGVCTLKQHSCSAGKKIELKMADLENGVFNKALFEMTRPGDDNHDH